MYLKNREELSDIHDIGKLPFSSRALLFQCVSHYEHRFYLRQYFSLFDTCVFFFPFLFEEYLDGMEDRKIIYERVRRDIEVLLKQEWAFDNVFLISVVDIGYL